MYHFTTHNTLSCFKNGNNLSQSMKCNLICYLFGHKYCVSTISIDILRLNTNVGELIHVIRHGGRRHGTLDNIMTSYVSIFFSLYIYSKNYLLICHSRVCICEKCTYKESLAYLMAQISFIR